jgi:hypothetical protein
MCPCSWYAIQLHERGVDVLKEFMIESEALEGFPTWKLSSNEAPTKIPSWFLVFIDDFGGSDVGWALDNLYAHGPYPMCPCSYYAIQLHERGVDVLEKFMIES